MSTSGWHQMAERWDEKMGEEFLASSPQGAWIAEIPLHCVIEAWKVSRGLLSDER